MGHWACLLNALVRSSLGGPSKRAAALSPRTLHTKNEGYVFGFAVV